MYLSESIHEYYTNEYTALFIIYSQWHTLPEKSPLITRVDKAVEAIN